MARHRRRGARRARVLGTAAVGVAMVGGLGLAGLRWGPTPELLDAALVTRLMVPSPTGGLLPTPARTSDVAAAAPSVGSGTASSTRVPMPVRTPVPTLPPSTPSGTPASKPTPTPVAVPVLVMNSSGTAVREAEARLHQLGLVPLRLVDGSYGTTTRDAVTRFQRANRLTASGTVDAATWTALRARTRTPTQAELLGVQLDARCLTGRVLCIDKTARRLAWVVDGSLRRVLDVRFGSEYTPTREGTFTVFWKHIDHVSTLYGSAMPYSMFFSRGQAVHYSSDFAARGYAGASHGCVNVRDRAGIRALYAEVRVGDSVVVYVS